MAISNVTVVDTTSKYIVKSTGIGSETDQELVDAKELTGGTNSVNCNLTKLSKGKIFFKNGAEGVFLALIPELKSALAVKITDGAARAAEVAIAGLISDLKIIDEAQLEKFKKKPVTNSTDQIIGYMNWSIN